MRHLLLFALLATSAVAGNKDFILRDIEDLFSDQTMTSSASVTSTDYVVRKETGVFISVLLSNLDSGATFTMTPLWSIKEDPADTPPGYPVQESNAAGAPVNQAVIDGVTDAEEFVMGFPVPPGARSFNLLLETSDANGVTANISITSR